MDTKALLSRLIAFDTVSRNSNLELIDFVADYLDGLGIATQRVFDETGAKANLVATIGPADVGGIILSGHTDVVPVDGQEWTSDPFQAVIRDDRLCGRGSADMKGFIASVCARVPAMLAAPLARPFVIALSYDEEVGCLGVRRLLAQMAQWPVKPIGCVVGEPTEMQVVIGHKAKRSLRVTIDGTAAHSSLAPQAVNAVEYGARLTVYIQDMGRRLAREGRRDPLYDVEHTTAHVGVLRGGQALNIVPERCVLDFELRALPEDDVDTFVDSIKAHAAQVLEPEMQAIAPQTGITFELLSGFPGLSTAPTDGFVGRLKRLVGRADHGKVAFGTEAGLFTQTIGVPAVVCGPGSIAQAHRADEYVELAQLERCDAFIDDLIDSCRA
ncbi:MAG: acetylornithine deacetylase [Burkholderiaceae bacterium]